MPHWLHKLNLVNLSELKQFDPRISNNHVSCSLTYFCIAALATYSSKESSKLQAIYNPVISFNHEQCIRNILILKSRKGYLCKIIKAVNLINCRESNLTPRPNVTPLRWWNTFLFDLLVYLSQNI